MPVGHLIEIILCLYGISLLDRKAFSSLHMLVDGVCAMPGLSAEQPPLPPPSSPPVSQPSSPPAAGFRSGFEDGTVPGPGHFHLQCEQPNTMSLEMLCFHLGVGRNL